MELPKYIKFAIEHEERCVQLRELQIAAYKQKIALLKAGMDRATVNKKIRPVDRWVKFDRIQYEKLKKEETKNGESKK